MAGNGRPTYKPELVDLIADMFRDGSSITQVAARKLGVTRQTYYEWKEQYPEFKKQADLGEQIAQSFHEDKLDATADGKMKDANGACRIFIMKCRFRETYQEAKDLQPIIPTAIETLLAGYELTPKK
jgi:transposase-like protein